MDEISRCRKIIGVGPEASLEDVKTAYEELAEAWHPDRFAGNERLKSKAQETLKEINAAYEFLIANSFQKDVPVATPQPASPPTPPISQSRVPQKEFAQPLDVKTAEHKSGVAAMVAIVVVVIFGCLFFYWKSQQHPADPAPASPATVSETNLPPAAATTNAVPVPEQK